MSNHKMLALEKIDEIVETSNIDQLLRAYFDRGDNEIIKEWLTNYIIRKIDCFETCLHVLRYCGDHNTQDADGLEDIVFNKACAMCVTYAQGIELLVIVKGKSVFEQITLNSMLDNIENNFIDSYGIYKISTDYPAICACALEKAERSATSFKQLALVCMSLEYGSEKYGLTANKMSTSSASFEEKLSAYKEFSKGRGKEYTNIRKTIYDILANDKLDFDQWQQIHGATVAEDYLNNLVIKQLISQANEFEHWDYIFDVGLTYGVWQHSLVEMLKLEARFSQWDNLYKKMYTKYDKDSKMYKLVLNKMIESAERFLQCFRVCKITQPGNAIYAKAFNKMSKLTPDFSEWWTVCLDPLNFIDDNLTKLLIKKQSYLELNFDQCSTICCGAKAWSDNEIKQNALLKRSTLAITFDQNREVYRDRHLVKDPYQREKVIKRSLNRMSEQAKLFDELQYIFEESCRSTSKMILRKAIKQAISADEIVWVILQTHTNCKSQIAGSALRKLSGLQMTFGGWSSVYPRIVCHDKAKRIVLGKMLDTASELSDWAFISGLD